MDQTVGGLLGPAESELMKHQLATTQELRDLIDRTPQGEVPDDLEGFVARCHGRLTAVRFEAAKVAEPAGPATEVRAKRARARACVTASPPVAAILAEAERDGFLTVVDDQPAGDEIRHQWAKRCVAAGRPLVEVNIQEDDLAGVMFFTETATFFDEDADYEPVEPAPEVLAAFEQHPGCRPMRWANGVDAISLPYDVAVAIARRLVSPGTPGAGPM